VAGTSSGLGLAVSSYLCETGLRKREPSMRILNILSGIAVLFTTLAFAHLLHHFSTHAPHESFRDPAFLGGMAAGVVVGIFSFIGACLLLRRGR
jgi:amino acid transporter